MSSLGVTLSRHISDVERRRPETTRDLSGLLNQIGLAAKVLSREIGRAALVGRLGLTGEKNTTGDSQKKLDLYGNQVIMDAFAASGLVAAAVSEEMDEVKQIDGAPSAKYILCVDPVDGSSNTDINGTLGTIFGFYRCAEHGGKRIAEKLCESSGQVLAGYVMYGASTVLVYTCGHGVHGFTLDRDLGEFFLSHENVLCPARGNSYSANLGRRREWDPSVQGFVEFLSQSDPDSRRPYSLRYTGALVADFHRCLLEGGCYFYPSDSGHPNGKLRLLYECAPLAFVAEQAGGGASTGAHRILDIRAGSIHQRSPLVIGSAEDVAQYEAFVSMSGSQPEAKR